LQNEPRRLGKVYKIPRRSAAGRFIENSIIYENTPYFGFQYLFDGTIGPILYIDSTHIPKIGFVFKMGILGTFMETAFIRRFVYNAGGRTVW
jgi:hypothetical protein